MRKTSEQALAAAWRLDGRHVLFGLLGFFAIVFVVNGIFMFQALSTYTGVVANEPYRKGLAYNQRIDADERQTKLAWHETVSVTREGHVSVAMADTAKAPVAGLTFTASLGRPSTNRFDRTIRLVEGAAGEYVANTGALDEGSWVITLEARAAASASPDPVFRARKRLWLK